jgi:predicted SAM-dependent methyltransferase
MGVIHGINVVVGIPSFGMVSTYFLQARISQQFPLVSSAIDKIVLNKPIADARNEIVEFALSQGANYIYWLDDDVIPPPDAFLKMYNQHKDIINGVYWSKSNPPMPLLFRGHLDGPYWDWHMGDLIEIDAAGSGLTLVKTDVYRKIQKEMGDPWYSVQYSSFAGVKETPYNNTEDLYFYWKARKVGYKVWADTSIQAFHFDKNTGILYGMPGNSPQAQTAWSILPAGDKLIADLGPGAVSPYMRDEGKVVSFDIREEVKPDVICDLRRLPVPDQTFDIVFSSHTLEHFAFNDVQKVLKEWVRILKVGGELRLVVPNLRHVGHRLAIDQVYPTDMMVLYGEQDYPKNFHAAGFTPRMLSALVGSLGCFEDIETAEQDTFGAPNATNWSLQLRARKVKHLEIDNITPEHIDPSPQTPNWWPMAIYPDLKERSMTEEEIAEDIKKAAEDKKPPAFDFFGPPEQRIWKAEEKVEPKQEEKDGLGSNRQDESSTPRRNARKASTSGGRRKSEVHSTGGL